MNVTLKLPDEVVRAARIRAVHADKSLSAWVADLVTRALAISASKEEKPISISEAMRVQDMPESFYDKDFPLPERRETKHRDFTFETENE